MVPSFLTLSLLIVSPRYDVDYVDLTTKQASTAYPQTHVLLMRLGKYWLSLSIEHADAEIKELSWISDNFGKKRSGYTLSRYDISLIFSVIFENTRTLQNLLNGMR
jgi:hypothetical protein